MKTIKNRDFKNLKFYEDESKNNIKEIILFQIRKAPAQGLTLGMINDRCNLIDDIEKKENIELEKTGWKLLKEIIEASKWFEGGNIAPSVEALKELNEMLQEIKKI